MAIPTFAKVKNKKLVLFFSGLVGAAAILTVGVNFLLKLATPQEPSPPQPFVPIETRRESESRSTPLYRIVAPPDEDPRAISYDTDGFSPTQVVISSSDPMGCLITVKNKTAQPMGVGVNPHNPQGDPGVNYGQIQPGGEAILDVRYPGLTDIGLHSHPTTIHQFRVIYGEGCR